MGSVFSTKGLQEALEAVPIHTPPTAKHRRIVNPEFDPRSPSNDVIRTPIVVAGTPMLRGSGSCPSSPNVCPSGPAMRLDLDPRSPLVDSVRTPILVARPTSDLIDPRSPSTDYVRTPILVASCSSGRVDQPRSIQDLTSGVESTRTRDLLIDSLLSLTPPPANHYVLTDRPALKMDQFEDSTVDPLDTMELLEDVRSTSIPNIDSIPAIAECDLDLSDKVINRSLSEPDLSKDDVQLLRRRNVPESNSFRESTPKKTSDRSKVSSPQVLSHEDLTSRSVVVRDMSPLGGKSESQRSPLSVRNGVDVNSPRVIVQRKQMTKLTMCMKVSKKHVDVPRLSMLRPPSKHTALNVTDKENRIKY